MENFIKSLSLKKGIISWSLFGFMICLNIAKHLWPSFFECFYIDVSNNTPLFSKILEGEIWRIFTPCLIHRDIWHCLYCVSWIIFIGCQIELFFGSLTLFMLILAIGVFSNCVQYLYSGYCFSGFSGVAAGLGAFLYRRQVSFKEVFYFPFLERAILILKPLCSFFAFLCVFFGIFPTLIINVDRLSQEWVGLSFLKVAHGVHLSSIVLGWVLGGILLKKKYAQRPSLNI